MAATALGAAAAPSAQALGVLTCTGSELATYSPGLTNTSQLTSVGLQASYQPCVNALNPLELRTGTATNTTSGMRSCTGVLLSGTGARTIHWSTGTTSTFSYTTTPNYVGGQLAQITQQGSITAGEFQGATAIGVVTLLGGDLSACDSAGVPSLGGPGLGCGNAQRSGFLMPRQRQDD